MIVSEERPWDFILCMSRRENWKKSLTFVSTISYSWCLHVYFVEKVTWKFAHTKIRPEAEQTEVISQKTKVPEGAYRMNETPERTDTRVPLWNFIGYLLPILCYTCVSLFFFFCGLLLCVASVCVSFGASKFRLPCLRFHVDFSSSSVMCSTTVTFIFAILVCIRVPKIYRFFGSQKLKFYNEKNPAKLTV